MNKDEQQKKITKLSDKADKPCFDFEAKQNAIGFFSILLEEAKKNPKLWKQICNKNNENNRSTNNTN